MQVASACSSLARISFLRTGCRPGGFALLNCLPSPTVTDPADPNGLFETAGTFTGLHFAIDDENNSPLSNFCGVVQTALGPFGNAFSNFRLYVDGRLVASKSIQYVPAQRCFFTGPVCWQAGNLPGQ